VLTGMYYFMKHKTSAYTIPMDFDFREPRLFIHDLIHRTKIGKDGARELLEKEMMDKCMYDLYVHLAEKGIVNPSKQSLESLRQMKETKVAELENEKQRDAENESHIKEIDRKIAEFYCQTMDIKKGFEWTTRIMRDDVSLSFRMDVFLCRIRMGIIMGNKKIIEESAVEAMDACERGCDWDRRNRFKVYNGLLCLMRGKFDEAGIMLSDSLPSYDADEAMDYWRAVRYVIFCGALTFERPDLLKRILQNADVVGNNEEEGMRIIRSLHECHYSNFMKELCAFCRIINDDVFVGKYVNMFCREMKLRVYGQILESYRSMHIEKMAEALGLGVEYVEKDLGEFIIEERLWSRIDRIERVIEMKERSSMDVSSVINEGSDVIRRIKRFVK